MVTVYTHRDGITVRKKRNVWVTIRNSIVSGKKPNTSELAQALGDFALLEATGRRVVRLHLDSPELGHVKRVCDVIAGATAINK